MKDWRIHHALSRWPKFFGLNEADQADLVRRIQSLIAEDRQNNIDNMRDEIERLRADAERYRWLRANMTGVINLIGRPTIGLSGMTGNDFDDAIDAAMKEYE